MSAFTFDKQTGNCSAGHFIDNNSPCIGQTLAELEIWSTVDFVPPEKVYVVTSSGYNHAGAEQACSGLGAGGTLGIVNTSPEMQAFTGDFLMVLYAQQTIHSYSQNV